MNQDLSQEETRRIIISDMVKQKNTIVPTIGDDVIVYKVMKYIRFGLFISVLFINFFVYGQNQQGYVKTKGRMVNGQHVQGKGLPGAVVFIQGRTSIGVRNPNGSFSFPIPSHQFIVKSVSKNGYQLVDADAAPKTYKYSPNPLFLLMETPEQQLQDQLDAERKIRHTLQTQLLKRENEIESMKISLSEKQKLLQQLYSAQKGNEQLISEMAKRYSETDFDQIDELNQRIGDCIINGRLLEADSLIKTKGDIKERINNLTLHHNTNIQVRIDLEKSEAMENRERLEIAQDCYSKYEMFKMSYKNDSAAYYIKLRAMLDTTNVDWIFDAAIYLKEQNQVEESEHFYMQLLKIIESDSSGISKSEISNIYNNIANLYDDTERFNECELYHKKALEIRQLLTDSNHHYDSDLAGTYNNLGVLYSHTQRIKESEQCYKASLDLRRELAKKDPEKYEPDLASTLNNLALLYSNTQRFTEAENLYKEALNIRRRYAKKDSLTYEPELAITLDKIAIMYNKEQKYALSEDFYKEALSIWRKFSIKNPNYYEPELANSLHNYSLLLLMMGKYSLCEEINKEALGIREKFAEMNPLVFESDLAQSYASMASFYSNIDHHSESEELYIKALEIRRKLSIRNPKRHEPELAILLNNIALFYNKIKNYSESEKYHLKAIKIQRRLSENAPSSYEADLALSLESISLLYFNTQRLDDGQQKCEEALKIFRRLAIQNPNVYEPHVAICLTTLYAITPNDELLRESLDFYKRLAQNVPQLYEPLYNQTWKLLFGNYSKNKNYDVCEQLYLKKIEFYQTIENKNKTYKQELAITLGNLADLYKRTKVYNNAIIYAQKASAFFEVLVQEDKNYRPYQAGAYDILAESYKNTHCLDSALIMYSRSLILLRIFVKEEPQKWDVSFVQTLSNLIDITGSNNQLLECETYCSELLGVLKKIQVTNESTKIIYKTYLELYTSLTSTNKHYENAYNALTEFYALIKKDYTRDPILHKLKFAQTCGNLSYYALLMKRFEEAEEIAREGINVDPSQRFIYTNLAASILLLGRYSEAEIIYLKFKEELRKSFIDDIEQFAEVGIIPKERKDDIERIKKILNE